MSEPAAQEEWRARKVRDWLLAVLRFAVTLDLSDRAGVLAIAEEMDRSGSRVDVPGFSFFVRTSIHLCDGILAANDPETAAGLRSHLKRIDDHRLRRALEAAIEFGRPTNASLAKKRNRGDLWKGLKQE